MPAPRLSNESKYFEDIFENNAHLQQRFSHVFNCPNSVWAESRHRQSIGKHIRGKTVLDYGCADGHSAVWLLENGAQAVAGIDLSFSAVSQARKRALAGAAFVVGDAHRLPWPDGTFDVVVGRAILHHLDMPVAARELRRVTKPGGHLFFVEPLADNPLLKLFRRLTPWARTVDERPLSRGDVEHFDTALGKPEHYFAGLVSMAAGTITSFLPLVSPQNPLLRLADLIDRSLMKTPARWWMGHGYFHWETPVA